MSVSRGVPLLYVYESQSVDFTVVGIPNLTHGAPRSSQSQGVETLKDLIKHKIKEDQKNSDTKIEDGDSTSPLDPSLEKHIDFWDSLGEESA